MGFQPRVSVETTLGSQRSFLALTISVFPCFPSDSGSGFATLYEQTLFATVQDSQFPANIQHILLDRSSGGTLIWQGFQLIQVDSDPCPRELTVEFWSEGKTERINVGVKVVPFRGPPKVN